MTKEMMKPALRNILFITALGSAFPALAVDCGRAASIVENTICNSPQLSWLDAVMNDANRDALAGKNSEPVLQRYRNWQESRNACTTTNCLRWAYLQGISAVYQAPENFNWDGIWWNTSATNGNGGKIVISKSSDWAFDFTGEIWGGVYKSTLRSNVRNYWGLGFTDRIAWGGECTVLFIPQPDGKIVINSDNSGSCKMLMQDDITLDGVYQRADTDPRPAATLQTIGVLPSQALDDRFRQLAGQDYQKYVAVANNVLYAEDQDDFGATVLTLSVKGAASRNAAMVMYTPSGKIWAMLVTPDKSKENGINISYITTEQGEKTPPKTLNNWRALFLN